MKRSSVYCVFLVGFILISQVPGRSQVVDEPCRYWPLCSDTFLQYDSGESWSVADTRVIDGSTGWVVQSSDESERVFICDEEGLKLLQMVFPNETCGNSIFTFSEPLLLLPTGVEFPSTGSVRATMTFECANEGSSVVSSFSGSLSYEEYLPTLTVPLGAFENVVKVRLGIQSRTGPLMIDYRFWLAQDIGPIQFEDVRQSGSLMSLTGGSVCGVPLQEEPLPTPTPTPLPIVPERADINQDGYVDQNDQFLLMENWHRGILPQ